MRVDLSVFSVVGPGGEPKDGLAPLFNGLVSCVDDTCISFSYVSNRDFCDRVIRRSSTVFYNLNGKVSSDRWPGEEQVPKMILTTRLCDITERVLRRRMKMSIHFARWPMTTSPRIWIRAFDLRALRCFISAYDIPIIKPLFTPAIHNLGTSL